MSIGDITAQGSPAISDIQSLINGSASAILRPKGAKGIAGFVFDYSTGDAVDLESDTTDHYTENGSFVNDHIVNKPIKITLNGLIGELVYRKPQGLLGALATLGGGLATVAAYGGNYTPQFFQKIQGIVGKTQAAVNSVNRYLNQAQSALKAINSLFGAQQTAQEIAFNSLWSLWKAKMIFGVDTPWAYFPSMTISNIGFRQDGDSISYSSIVVTMKEFRGASTKLTTFAGDSPDINGIQTSEPVAQGNAGSNDTSLLQLTNSNGLTGQITGGAK